MTAMDGIDISAQIQKERLPRTTKRNTHAINAARQGKTFKIFGETSNRGRNV